MTDQEHGADGRFDEISTSEEVGPYVLDLCTMPGPISIPQPESELLRRFSFFVSRRHEVGRDTYWLCMGYFPTRGEAQKWLDLMRRVYPDAWITPADVTVAPSRPEE
jgi:hypothetical protein